MQSLPEIVGLVFDMDGLLIDSEQLSMEALGSAGAAMGCEMPEAFRRGMIGSPADRCAAMLRERFGDGFAAEELLQLHGRHLDAMVAAGRLELKPGVTALLDELERRGIGRAVATSSGRARALHHLRAVGILDRFALVVAREDVPRGKPFPDPFLHAAAGLGAEPTRCLALEDSHAGVRAAHAAGMVVVMVPDLLEATAEMRALAFAVAPDLFAVAGMLPVRG